MTPQDGMTPPQDRPTDPEPTPRPITEADLERVLERRLDEELRPIRMMLLDVHNVVMGNMSKSGERKGGFGSHFVHIDDKLASINSNTESTVVELKGDEETLPIHERIAQILGSRILSIFERTYKPDMASMRAEIAAVTSRVAELEEDVPRGKQ